MSVTIPPVICMHSWGARGQLFYSFAVVTVSCITEKTCTGFPKCVPVLLPESQMRPLPFWENTNIAIRQPVRHWRYEELGAPGPSLLETSWLRRILRQQGTALYLKCEAAECLSKGLNNISEIVMAKGPLWCLLWYILLFYTLVYSKLIQVQNSK
jgi:hypothetical protein